MEVGKERKRGEDLFFFFFFPFHFWKRRKFVLSLPKWELSTGKRRFHAGKKSGKMTLPPQKNVPVTPWYRQIHTLVDGSSVRHKELTDIEWRSPTTYIHDEILTLKILKWLWKSMKLSKTKELSNPEFFQRYFSAFSVLNLLPIMSTEIHLNHPKWFFAWWHCKTSQYFFRLISSFSVWLAKCKNQYSNKGCFTIRVHHLSHFWWKMKCFVIPQHAFFCIMNKPYIDYIKLLTYRHNLSWIQLK